MKFSLALLDSPADLAQLCGANLDIYAGEIVGNDIQYMWQVFDNDPPCNHVNNGARPYNDLKDVSRQKAFRCEGTCGREQSPDGIEVLEMNFRNNPLYHFTIHKNRKYGMYGLDGKSYGRCILFPGHSYVCPGFGANTAGNRKSRCLAQFTARKVGWAH